MSSSSRILKEKSNEYSQRLLLIEKVVGDLLSPPHYTDHFISHGKRVSRIIESIIPENSIASLNSFEQFILLCSAYLHDIGYYVSRENHNEHSAIFINNNFHLMGLDPIEASLVSAISFSHNISVDLKDTPEIITVGSYNVRLRFLSALLIIADALDIDFRRGRVLKYNEDMSENINKVYQAISGVNFDHNKKEIVIFVIDFPDFFDNRYYNMLHDDLIETFDKVKNVLKDNGILYEKIVFKKHDIYMRGIKL